MNIYILVYNNYEASENICVSVDEYDTLLNLIKDKYSDFNKMCGDVFCWTRGRREYLTIQHWVDGKRQDEY